MFSCYSDSSNKKVSEELLFGQFFCAGLLLLTTQIGHICSWCNNLMHNDASFGIFFVRLIILLCLKKKLEKKDFVSPTHMLNRLVWAPKIVKTYIIVTWVIAWLQSYSKQPNSKLLYLNFSDFFRQSVT